MTRATSRDEAQWITTSIDGQTNLVVPLARASGRWSGRNRIFKRAGALLKGANGASLIGLKSAGGHATAKMLTDDIGEPSISLP